MSIRIKVLHALGLLRRPVITPFRGFGNGNSVEVWGKVTENNDLLRMSRRNSVFANLFSTWKRYFAVAIPDVKLSIILLGKEVFATTNHNGIFHASIPISDIKDAHEGWYPVRYETCISRYIPEHVCVCTEGTAYIDRGGNQFGIISDIDDTILVSRATNLIKTVFTLAANNARTRLPFLGVAELYQAFYKGTSGTGTNPFFYISSSQWNLYDFLVEFLDRHDLPQGILLLKETHNIWDVFAKRKDHSHKLQKIRTVLSMLPDIPFVLLGDTGQSDPLIYAEIAQEFPDRIAAIYLRDVTPGHDQNVSAALKKLANLPVHIVTVRTTEEMARHAIAHGYIKADPTTIAD